MRSICIFYPNFDLDSIVKDLSFDWEFLNNLLEQVPPSKVERVLDEQSPLTVILGKLLYCPIFTLLKPLCAIFMFLKVESGDPFNTLTSGSTADPVYMPHSYVSKISEKHIEEVGDRDSIKASIVRKIFFKIKTPVICTSITFKRKYGRFVWIFVILRGFFQIGLVVFLIW